MTIQTICEDKRPIAGLSSDLHAADIAWVGTDGVTEIVAYEEAGQMAYVAFYAIKKGEHIHRRVPAAHVSVTYAEHTA